MFFPMTNVLCPGQRAGRVAKRSTSRRCMRVVADTDVGAAKGYSLHRILDSSFQLTIKALTFFPRHALTRTWNPDFTLAAASRSAS